MIEYISDLRLFCEICKTHNFRLAGEKLGYSPAVVSMRVKRLETVTGKTLFLRTTRQITLTEEGKTLQDLAIKTLDLAELMATPRNRGGSTPIQGTVRITAPHSFARIFLIEPIQNIHRTNKELTIDLVLSDSISQLVKESIDISFRIGGQDEPSMDSENILLDRRILVASPTYLDKHGTPKSPNDLKHHSCLSYSNMKQWQLEKTGQKQKITLSHVLYCNTGEYLAKLAANGAGITVKSQWAIQQELENGQLTRVLPEYTLGNDQHVKILTPKRDVTPNRVSYVIEQIKTHVSSMGY